MLDFKEDVAVLASESPVGRTGPLAAWAAIAAGALRAGAARWRWRRARWSRSAWPSPVYHDSSRRSGCSPGCSSETGFAAIWRRPFHHVLHAIDTPERDLGLLAGLLARIESERFTSPRLAALQQTLLTDGVPPSKRIAQLRTLVSWLDSTHNMMFAPIAFVLLLRQQLAIAIDRWHAAYGPAVGRVAARASARSRRWRRWPPSPTSGPTIRFPSSPTRARSTRPRGSAIR